MANYMIFKSLVDFVNSPEFVIDSLDYFDSISGEDTLSQCIEDIFLFNADMIAEMQSI